MKKTKLLKMLELYKEWEYKQENYESSACINLLIDLLKRDNLDSLIQQLNEQLNKDHTKN